MGDTSDYHQRSEKPTAQHPVMASSVREPAVSTPAKAMSSQLSSSSSVAAVSMTLSKDSSPPQVSESSISAPGPRKISSSDVESSPPQISTLPNVSSAPPLSTPPRLSSPPRMVQGLRPPTSAAAEVTLAGSKYLSTGPSSRPASPPRLCASPALTDSVSRPAAFSLVPPVPSPVSESEVHPTKAALPPTASGPSTTVSSSAMVSTSSYSSVSAPISSLQQMVQGSKNPMMTSCLSDTSAAQHEAPKLMSVTSFLSVTENSSTGVTPSLSISGPSSSPSRFSVTSPSSVSKTPSVGNKPCDPVPKLQRHSLYTSPAVDSGLSTTSAASTQPEEGNVSSLAAQEHPTARPLSTLPLLTTQASRTAPVSAPPALVSVPPAMGTSSGVVQSSDSEQHYPNSRLPHMPKPSSLQPEHHEDRKALANENGRKQEECLPQPNSGPIRTPQNIRASRTETQKSDVHTHKSFDLPGNRLQTSVTPEQKPKNRQRESEKQHIHSSVHDIHEAGDSTSEKTPRRESSHCQSTRVKHLTEEESFDDSSQFDGSSAFDTSSRINVSSFLDKTSLIDDSSCIDESSSFDNSFQPGKDTSQFGNTSHADEEPSTTLDTTRDSSSSVEYSRDDTLDSTREEGTRNSCPITGESTLQSSLNNTSQMEEPPFDTSDASMSCSFGPTQPGPPGTFFKFIIMETSRTLSSI